MNEIYGVSGLSFTELEHEKTRLRSNSKYVQEFENITTYVRDGVTADSWLVYALADIKFHSVKTAAPMIMWCYVEKDSEGNFHIINDAGSFGECAPVCGDLQSFGGGAEAGIQCKCEAEGSPEFR